MPERDQDKLGVVMYSCLHGQSPRHLTDFCVPVSDVSARQHLRSATRRFLMVPRCQLSTLGPRAFFVAGPSLWNSLPDSLRDSDLRRDNFRRLYLLVCIKSKRAYATDPKQHEGTCNKYVISYNFILLDKDARTVSKQWQVSARQYLSWIKQHN